MVYFVKARECDFLQIDELLLLSKETMAKHGIKQWNLNYPSANNVRNDINNGSLYILKDDSGNVKCAGSLIRKSDLEYSVQRVMTDPVESGKGLASQLIQEMERVAKSNSVQELNSLTNYRNFTMQKVFEKNNFVKVGEQLDPNRKEAGLFYIYHKFL